MYTPAHFTIPDELQRRILADPGAGELVTAGSSGLMATHLPYLFDPELGEAGSLILHVARPNQQWREAPCEALFVITVASDYISSLWYPSAADSKDYVPTWDYVTLHLYGGLIAHDDLAWTTRAVELLMAAHETTIGLADMPAKLTAGLLRAIVGLQVEVTRIEAKAKLSQNRTPADVQGVIEGLDRAGADDMSRLVTEFGLPAAQRKAAVVEQARRRKS